MFLACSTRKRDLRGRLLLAKEDFREFQARLNEIEEGGEVLILGKKEKGDPFAEREGTPKQRGIFSGREVFLTGKNPCSPKKNLCVLLRKEIPPNCLGGKGKEKPEEGGKGTSPVLGKKGGEGQFYRGLPDGKKGLPPFLGEG